MKLASTRFSSALIFTNTTTDPLLTSWRSLSSRSISLMSCVVVRIGVTPHNIAVAPTTSALGVTANT